MTGGGSPHRYLPNNRHPELVSGSPCRSAELAEILKQVQDDETTTTKPIHNSQFYAIFTSACYARAMETPLDHVLNSFADVRPEHLVPMLSMLALVIAMTWYRRRYVGRFRTTWHPNTGWQHRLIRFPTNPSAERLSKIQRKLKLSDVAMENLVREKLGERV